MKMRQTFPLRRKKKVKIEKIKYNKYIHTRKCGSFHGDMRRTRFLIPAVSSNVCSHSSYDIGLSTLYLCWLIDKQDIHTYVFLGSRSCEEQYELRVVQISSSEFSRAQLSKRFALPTFSVPSRQSTYAAPILPSRGQRMDCPFFLISGSTISEILAVHSPSCLFVSFLALSMKVVERWCTLTPFTSFISVLWGLLLEDKDDGKKAAGDLAEIGERQRHRGRMIWENKLQNTMLSVQTIQFSMKIKQDTTN